MIECNLPLIEQGKTRVYFDGGYVDHIKNVHLDANDHEIVVRSEKTTFYTGNKKTRRERYNVQLEPRNIEDYLKLEVARLAKGTNRATENIPRPREYGITLEAAEFPSSKSRHIEVSEFPSSKNRYIIETPKDCNLKIVM